MHRAEWCRYCGHAASFSHALQWAAARVSRLKYLSGRQAISSLSQAAHQLLTSSLDICPGVSRAGLPSIWPAVRVAAIAGPARPCSARTAEHRPWGWQASRLPKPTSRPPGDAIRMAFECGQQQVGLSCSSKKQNGARHSRVAACFFGTALQRRGPPATATRRIGHDQRSGRSRPHNRAESPACRRWRRTSPAEATWGPNSEAERSRLIDTEAVPTHGRHEQARRSSNAIACSRADRESRRTAGSGPWPSESEILKRMTCYPLPSEFGQPHMRDLSLDRNEEVGPDGLAGRPSVAVGVFRAMASAHFRAEKQAGLRIRARASPTEKWAHDSQADSMTATTHWMNKTATTTANSATRDRWRTGMARLIR